MPDGTTTSWAEPTEHAGNPLLGVSMRLPPQHVQAEQSLLGTILANNRAYDRVSAFLRPEHFYDPMHGRIYRAISRRLDNDKPVDMLILKSDMEKAGALEEAGGAQYVANLVTAMVGVISAGEYGRAIFDAWERRQLIDIGTRMVEQAFLGSPDENSTSLVDEIEAELDRLSDRSSEDEDRMVSLADAMKLAADEGEATKSGKLPPAPSTGLPSLDKAILRLRPGHLIVLAGRPGMGKSALAKGIARSVACGLGMTADGEIIDDPSLGRPVLYFSQEEEDVDLGASMIAQMTGIEVDRVLSGDITPAEGAKVVAAQKRVRDVKFGVHDAPDQTLVSIARKARKAKRLFGGLSLVVVDYLQIMADPVGVREKRLAVGANIYGLKALAKRLGCPVLALSQLSRAVEQTTDKRPNMGHLRETSQIEDAADAIILAFREEYYLGQEVPHRGDESDGEYQEKMAAWQEKMNAVAGLAELIIPKVRRGRAPQIVKLHFNGPKTCFEELSRV